jgi:hypothetical protein
MPMKKKQNDVDAFLALPDAEKERIWESYNRVIPFEETRALTPREQAEWDRFAGTAKAARGERRRGRPVVGQGAKRVQVSVEGGLLKRADAYAARHGLTRAQLVARGLKLALADASGAAARP